MPAKQESCCFTGHRPNKLPWGYREEDPRCLLLKNRIRDALEAAWEEGYRHFLCGMAMGCDLYFAEAVLDLRRRGKHLTLEAAVPCPAQADRWPSAQRLRYQKLLSQCDYVTVLSAVYTPGCMQLRDRYMVDHASLLIAAFDGSSGGTRYTVEYALRRRCGVVDLPIPEIL